MSPSNPLSRRQFLRSAGLAFAATLAPKPLELALAGIARGATQLAEGYGPLVPDPAGLLDLPPGFQYALFSTSARASLGITRFHDTLSNGDPVPADHDGMHAFAGPDGMTILVRNHELDPGTGPIVDPARRRPYDPLGLGGTTTLWVDRDRKLVRSFASLSGTYRNCAGGATPWGSWLSAEECAYLPGGADARNADMIEGATKRHGYIFEVDSRADDLVDPVPLVGMGRFRHEAVAIDPATGTAYLTEDRKDGLFYRFRPSAVATEGKRPNQLRVGDYARGGTLEALWIVGRRGARTQNWDSAGIKLGERLRVDWLRIPVPDPDMDEERDPTDPKAHSPQEARPRTAPTSTRAQGYELGAAQFARTEGITYSRGSLYFCCTEGGPAKLGQVFRLDIARNELSLVVEPNDGALLDGPDNICVAPNGDLVVCEDGTGEDHVVGVTRDGRLYKLARMASAGYEEFAGATFAPDGRTLFVNLQRPGLTFAVWGPWRARRA